ncbi:MAG: ankyrin repeat domain-containing protein [Sulfurimonas sp.]|nr:ankyrin repeat domain-containing protein [Sulfurimonas sp.]
MNTWLEILRNNNFIGAKQYIKKDADLNDESDIGESVLAFALRYRCDEELIELLINSGADVLDFDNEGVSIFDVAITYNNLFVVEYILQKGIDVNKTTRRSRFTPLMCAACYGHVNIIKLLLDRGANKETKDSKGFSAADFARKMNKKHVLELLESYESISQN